MAQPDPGVEAPRFTAWRPSRRPDSAKWGDIPNLYRAYGIDFEAILEATARVLAS